MLFDVFVREAAALNGKCESVAFFMTGRRFRQALAK